MAKVEVLTDEEFNEAKAEQQQQAHDAMMNLLEKLITMLDQDKSKELRAFMATQNGVLQDMATKMEALTKPPVTNVNVDNAPVITMVQEFRKEIQRLIADQGKLVDAINRKPKSLHVHRTGISQLIDHIDIEYDNYKIS